MKKYLIIFILFLYSLATQAQWTNGQNMTYVLGVSDYVSSGNVSTPGMFVDETNNKLYVSNVCQNTVLRYSLPITSNNQAAELVLGTDGTSGCTSSLMNKPVGVCIINGTLYVGDGANNRILYWNNINSISTNGTAANGVIGQTNFTNNSSNAGGSTSSTGFNFYGGNTGIYGCGDGNTYGGYLTTYNGSLYVSDIGNNRVLVYNNLAGSASYVIGQTTMAGNSSGLSSSTLNTPFGIYIKNDYLYVVDGTNYRVLRFNNVSSISSNGVSANGVYGQPDFVTNLGAMTNTQFDLPIGVTVDGNGTLYITDSNNGRVVTINNASSNSGSVVFSNVLGEANFTSYSNTITQSKLYAGVTGIIVHSSVKKLYVGNNGAARIAVWTASSALPIVFYNVYISNNILKAKYSLEKDVIKLVVQSSNDGINFVDEKELSNGSVIEYGVEEETYYRIKVVYSNDKVDYSETVYNKNTNDFYLVNGLLDSKDLVEYEIYNEYGVKLESGSTYSKDFNTVDYNGFYIVKIVRNSEIINLKFFRK